MSWLCKCFNSNGYHSARSVLTLLSQPRSKLPKQQRARPPDNNTQQREQRIAPTIIQLVIQTRRKQREPKPSQASQHRRRRDGTSSIPRVRIDQEALDTLEPDNHAGAEQRRANVGPDPMRVVLRRPAVDNKTHWHKHGAGDHHRHAELGASRSSVGNVAALECGVDAVLERGARLRADEEAEAEGDVVEATDADGFAVLDRPEGGEGREHEVHEPVEVHHVESEALDQRLRAEEAEGACEGDAEGARDGAVWVVKVGVQRRVARLLDETLLPPCKEHRREGLLQDEEADGLDDGCEDGGAVEDPAPRRVLGDEAAGDGADGRAQERHERVDADCLAALFCFE